MPWFVSQCMAAIEKRGKTRLINGSRLINGLLSHPGIPGVTLCFCTGSYASGGGRRVLFMR